MVTAYMSVYVSGERGWDSVILPTYSLLLLATVFLGDLYFRKITPVTVGVLRWNLIVLTSILLFSILFIRPDQ